jgi:outer membrane protein assembly factor BamD (BamD/ComL family)
MKRCLLVLFAIMMILSTTACQSASPVFDAKMKPEDYFQRAQERVDQGDFTNALAYYYKFKEVFPNDLEKNIWASYEIALLYHKMGEDTKSLKLLDELIALYTQDKTQVLPKAPKMLAEKVKDNILNKDKYANQTAKPPANVK